MDSDEEIFFDSISEKEVVAIERLKQISAETSLERLEQDTDVNITYDPACEDIQGDNIENEKVEKKENPNGKTQDCRDVCLKDLSLTLPESCEIFEPHDLLLCSSFKSKILHNEKEEIEDCPYVQFENKMDDIYEVNLPQKLANSIEQSDYKSRISADVCSNRTSGDFPNGIECVDGKSSPVFANPLCLKGSSLSSTIDHPSILQLRTKSICTIQTPSEPAIDCTPERHSNISIHINNSQNPLLGNYLPKLTETKCTDFCEFEKMSYMQESIGAESSSILLSSFSDSTSECVGLNTTLDEVEMVLNRGMEYILSANDVEGKNDVSSDQNLDNSSCLKKEMSLPFNYGPCRQGDFNISKEVNLEEFTSLKEDTSAASSAFLPICFNKIAADQKNIRDIGKDNANVLHVPLKNSVKKTGKSIYSSKKQHFPDIKSPIAEYIKNNPTKQLTTAVKVHSKNKHGHLGVLHASPVPHVVHPSSNFPEKPVLPEISYESAPVINCKGAGINKSYAAVPVAQNTPKIQKHRGRAVLSAVSENMNNCIKNSEVSVIYDKDVSETSTLIR